MIFDFDSGAPEFDGAKYEPSTTHIFTGKLTQLIGLRFWKSQRIRKEKWGHAV